MIRFLRDEDGTIHVEHALFLALLVVSAIVLWTQFGGAIRSSVSSSSTAYATVLGEGGSGGTSDRAGVW